MAFSLGSPIDRLPRARLVPLYLMSCFLYYEQGNSVLSDAEFDRLARRLHAEWDLVVHQNKNLLTRAQVLTSGFQIQYPTRVKLAALQWLKEHDPKDKFACTSFSAP